VLFYLVSLARNHRDLPPIRKSYREPAIVTFKTIGIWNLIWGQFTELLLTGKFSLQGNGLLLDHCKSWHPITAARLASQSPLLLVCFNWQLLTDCLTRTAVQHVKLRKPLHTFMVMELYKQGCYIFQMKMSKNLQNAQRNLPFPQNNCTLSI